MKDSNRQKILIFAIIALVITNIVSLSFMWSLRKEDSKPPTQHTSENRGGMGNFVVKQLDLDSAQQKVYYEMRDNFVKKQRVLMDSVRNLRKDFFEQLTNDRLDSIGIEKYAATISEVQSKLDSRTFNHFRNVRSICTPEQAAKYDTITKEIIRRMIEPRWGNNNRGNRHPDSLKRDNRPPHPTKSKNE